MTQVAPLKTRLDQLQEDATTIKGGPRLITPAVVPTSPMRPDRKRNVLLGLGVGLTFGVALAFGFEHLDDSIKSSEHLQRSAGGLPVLGLIPLSIRWRKHSEAYLVAREESRSGAGEAYRALRTSIQFFGVDRSLRVVMITSPNASEGKSTTVANLAVVLARAGERVIVVSCDLRRPRIHEFFRLPNDVGFTSVLLGETPLSAALQPVPGEERLSLLASGPLPPDPSEVLGSARTTELLRALKAEADVILLDVPPVLPVTDASVLSSRSDGVLVVARAATTSARAFGRALELLRQVGAPLTGVVLNGVRLEDAHSYGYGYGYYVREDARNARSSRDPKQPV